MPLYTGRLPISAELIIESEGAVSLKRRLTSWLKFLFWTCRKKRVSFQNSDFGFHISFFEAVLCMYSGRWRFWFEQGNCLSSWPIEVVVFKNSVAKVNLSGAPPWISVRQDIWRIQPEESIYRISSYSFRGNYSFLNLEIQRSQYIKVRKLFKAGNYMRKYGIYFVIS